VVYRTDCVYRVSGRTVCGTRVQLLYSIQLAFEGERGPKPGPNIKKRHGVPKNLEFMAGMRIIWCMQYGIVI